MPGFADKFRLNRNRIFLLAGIAALLIAVAVFFIVRLNNQITTQREQQAEAARVEVQQSSLRAPSSDGLTLYLNASDVRATAVLAGIRYLATSGGLVAVDETGNVRKRYTTLDGLPDNDLTALAVFRERLFMGTASAGLVSFDGNEFTGYRFEKPKATRVSALEATPSELLIGTLDGGLFEYDGEKFSRRFNSTTGADFNRVTALLAKDSRVFIGTQDQGLYIWREAQIAKVTTSEGLPSSHVTALAVLPSNFSDVGQIAVATDFGVAALNDSNEIKPLSNQTNVTSLAVSDSRLWAGLFSGGVIDLTDDRARGKANTDKAKAEVAGLPGAIPTTVYIDESGLWALTTHGAFVRDSYSAGPGFESIARSIAGNQSITASHITGLAFDPQSRLWIAYFDRGVDVIASETGERLSHIQDDRVREVNFIAFDDSEDRLLVATSRGLVIIDGQFKQSVLTKDQNGLISDSVAHVSIADSASSLASTSPLGIGARNRALVLATGGGLTEISGGRARSITAFHGLASNHLYTSLAVGSRLYVGSLAGLAELEGLRVTHTYKTSNSKLSHDWVTALAEFEGTLYIGTNGGGVDALLPTGEWINFSNELGKFEVNQSAMRVDGERIYVGTTDRGLLVYNTRDRVWSRISAGLPSQNVTALISDDHFIYVGTLNGLVRIEKRVIE
jgi:ligand-binding sensor domain-containing protein